MYISKNNKRLFMFIVRHHQSYNIRFVPEWNFNEVNNRCFLGNYVRKMRSHLPECLLGRSVHYTIVQYSTLYRQGELWVPKTRLVSGSHLLHLGPGVWCHLLSQHLVQLVLKYQKKLEVLMVTNIFLNVEPKWIVNDSWV